jgi:hypothetical protein
MNDDAQAARDDLAFLRNLVGGGDERATTRVFGQIYFLAGLIYGGQMLGHAAQALGWLPQNSGVGLLVGIGPSVLFLPLLFWIQWRNRAAKPGGATSRAVASMFGIAGLSNLALIAVIGSVAWREHSLTTWLIYPCCVFVLQGAAWLFAFLMRKRTWFALVAAGWFACAIAMALTVTMTGYFILFAGLGLWLCMALPGWATLRGTRAAG